MAASSTSAVTASSAVSTFVLDAVGLTLDILTSVGQLSHSSKKRKRGSADNIQNVLALNTLLSQPSNCIGKRIKLSPQVIKAHQATVDCFKHIAPPVVTSEATMSVKVKTVEDDNANLVFDRPGKKLCINGKSCAAFMIDGPPQKPLNVYDGPTGESTGMCLLCIRNEAATICQLHPAKDANPLPRSSALHQHMQQGRRIPQRIHGGASRVPGDNLGRSTSWDPAWRSASNTTPGAAVFTLIRAQASIDQIL